MKKSIFISLSLLLSFGMVDVSAQNLLKRIGKAIEKEVVKEVDKKINQLKDGKNQQSESQNQTQQQPQTQPQGQSQTQNQAQTQPEQPNVEQNKRMAPTIVEAEPNNAPTTGKINDHEWVDLGLPSGTLWATCNVGATQASQPGAHYAWGEVATKSSYSAENCKSYKKELRDFSGNNANDVATAKWGNGWRMPTKTDFDELLHYCDWDYVEKDGRWGSEITSTINKKSIFLPATGYKEDTKLQDDSGNGLYWTSTPHVDEWNSGAYMYQFGGALGEVSVGDRTYGFAIRPVADNNTMINTPSQGETNGHKWVDLGLPSGTKWATCNLGAATSEHHGEFYAWAEITPILDKTSPKNAVRGKWMSGIGGSATYDAATAIWGEGWKMPTKANFQELMENCTWEWTTLGRITGCKVTSKINGNYIFLPAAGTMDPNSLYLFPNNLNQSAYYWASTPSKDEHSINADAFLAIKTFLGTTVQDRRQGFAIRPVTK